MHSGRVSGCGLLLFGHQLGAPRAKARHQQAQTALEAAWALAGFDRRRATCTA
jgi:hypothetical protein